MGPELSGDTVAIILGASEWPNAEQLPGSLSFKNSASSIQAYLLEANGLNIKPENLLNLFDDTRGASDIDYEIDTFLRKANKRLGEINNLILYYTGHGAFVEGDQKYCLTIRSSRPGALGVSGYRVASLARTLNRNVSDARKFIIIDACYAAAATSDFIPQSDAATRMEEQTMAGLAESGTALLCAASSADVALAPKFANYTMFSEAILTVLRDGSPNRGAFLSFDDLRILATNLIREKYKDEGVLPEVHIPDQRRGDLSKVKFLPNSAIGREQRPLTKIELIIHQVTLGFKGIFRRFVWPHTQSIFILTIGAISGSISHLFFDNSPRWLQTNNDFFVYFGLIVFPTDIIPGIVFGIAVASYLAMSGCRSAKKLALTVVIVCFGWIMAHQVATALYIYAGDFQRKNPLSPTGEMIGIPYIKIIIGMIAGLVGGLFVVVAVALTQVRFRRPEAYSLTLIAAVSCGALLEVKMDEGFHYGASWKEKNAIALLFVIWQCAVLFSINYSLSQVRDKTPL